MKQWLILEISFLQGHLTDVQLIPCIFWLITKPVKISVVYLNADVYKISFPSCQYHKSDTAAREAHSAFSSPFKLSSIISFSSSFANDGT